jgi:hypothetical protein
MFTMKSEVVAKPSVAKDNIAGSAHENISERQHFTLSKLSCEFP